VPRRSIVILATLLLSAGCDSHHVTAHRPAPTPSATPSASPVPVRSGTIHAKTTTFRIRLAGTRTTRSYRGDGFSTTAGSGQTFLVVNLRVTNTGKVSWALAVDEPTPVILHARDGSSYSPKSWYNELGIKPGKTRTIVEVFEVPRRTEFGSVTIAVPDAHGDLSAIQLNAS
jgi:hypothetical protein